MGRIGEYLSGPTKTTGEWAEYLNVYDANDVTVLRDRLETLLLHDPQGGLPRGVSPGVLLRFHALPDGVILRGEFAEGQQIARRENRRGAPAPIADGLAAPGGVIHHAIHSPPPGYPSVSLRYKSKCAPASLGLNCRLPTVEKDGADGALLLSDFAADYVLGTDVTSSLSRSSVIGLNGLCLLNGVGARAESVKHDDTVQCVQGRLVLLRRVWRPKMLNACGGCGDDSSGSVLDGEVTLRGTPTGDTSYARILGIKTDAHGEVKRAFLEAIKFWKEEGELVEQRLAARRATTRNNRTRGLGRGNG